MNVGDLKKLLNALPPHCDEFRVEFVDQVVQINAANFKRQDRPVFGSFLDEHSKEFLLANQEQFEQLKTYAEQKPNPGCHSGQHISSGNERSRK